MLALVFFVQLAFCQLTAITYECHGGKYPEYNLIAFNDHQGISYSFPTCTYDSSGKKIDPDKSLVKITAFDCNKKMQKEWLYDLNSKKLTVIMDWYAYVNSDIKKLGKKRDIDGYLCNLIEETNLSGKFYYWCTTEMNYNWLLGIYDSEGTVVEAYEDDSLTMHLKSIENDVSFSDTIFPSEILSEIISAW